MTTLAALLGALPLMVSWGVGAELRRPLGIAMVGGLIFSQLLTHVHDTGDLPLLRPLGCPLAQALAPTRTNDING